MRLASATPIASNGSRLTASSPYALSSSPPSSPSWPSSPYCPPSRGSWRYRNSAVANRVHCAPITTAVCKKQRIRLTNGGQRASAASNGRRAEFAHPRVRDVCERFRHVARPQFSLNSRNPRGTGISFNARAIAARARAARRHRKCVARGCDGSLRNRLRGVRKNFPLVGSIGRCAEEKTRRKERISAK